MHQISEKTAEIKVRKKQIFRDVRGLITRWSHDKVLSDDMAWGSHC